MAEPPEAALDDVPVASLPRPLALAIFQLLPLDTRLRCVEVCRAWRRVFSEPQMWTEIDFWELRDDQRGTPLTAKLLWASVERARGQMTYLDLIHCAADEAAIMAAVASNGASLRVLVLPWESQRYLPTEFLRNLLRVAFELRELYADLGCTSDNTTMVPAADAIPILRGRWPWARLWTRRVQLSFRQGDTDTVRALTEALRKQNGDMTFLNLDFNGTDLPADVFADFCDAVVSMGLPCLRLCDCGLGPETGPALVRLLREGCVEELSLCVITRLLDENSVVPVAEALRQNDRLLTLNLIFADLFRDPRVGIALSEALVGHTSITSLFLASNMIQPHVAGAVGNVYASSVTANAPALQELNVADCVGLSLDNLLPLVKALPSNTHLRHLNLTPGLPVDVYESNAFAAWEKDVLIPAVEANTSLRSLKFTVLDSPAKEHIDALLAARCAADEAAEQRKRKGKALGDEAAKLAAELGAAAMVQAP